MVIAFQCPAFQYLCCYSKWPWAGKKAKFTITAKEFVLLNLSGKIRFKWLLAISISVLIINVVNLIVLEVGEWRMAVANEEARFLGKKGLADTMFTGELLLQVFLFKPRINKLFAKSLVHTKIGFWVPGRCSSVFKIRIKISSLQDLKVSKVAIKIADCDTLGNKSGKSMARY